MPRPPEPRTNCDGCGCAQDGCDSCWGESDDQYYLPYKPEPRHKSRYGRNSGVIDCDGCGCGNRQCETCKGFRELWSDNDDEGDEGDDDDDDDEDDVDDEDIEDNDKDNDDGNGDDDDDDDDGGDRTEYRENVLEAWRGKRRLEDPSESSSRRDSGRKRRRVEEGDGGDGDDYDEEEQEEEEEFEDGAAGEPSFKDMVNALSEQTARDTLVRLASMAPSAQVAIRQAYSRQIQESAQRPVDWDFLSKKVWHLLYTSREAELYRTASEERRAQLVRRIWDQIDRHFLSMCKSGRPPFASKLSALATARKMLKSVLLGIPGSLAGAARDGLRAPGNAQASMVAIQLAMTQMTKQEKIRAGGTYDEKGTLLQKYTWCRDEARKLGLESLKGLDQILVELAGHAEW